MRFARPFLLLALMICALPTARAQLVLSVDSVDASQFPTIRLVVHVTLNGLAYSPLRVTDYTLSEDGRSLPVTAGFCQDSITRPPLSVLMIIDRSNSMGPWPWGSNAIVAARQAAADFVGRLAAQDEGAVLVFNQTSDVAQNWTTDKPLLASRINAITTTGGTALWDALIRGASMITPRSGRQVVVVLTDGRDESSSASFSAVLSSYSGKPITVYAIGLGSSINDTELRSLAQATGGRYYRAPSSSDLDAIYREISQQVTSTGICELHYRSPVDCLDGGLHTIRVTVTTPSGVATREATYRAPEDSSTFSLATLAIPPNAVVEAASHLALPVTVRELSTKRPPRMFSWELDYDTLIVRVDSITTTIPGARITASRARGFLSVLLQSPQPLDSAQVLCVIHLAGLPTDPTRRSPLHLRSFSVDQPCTVLNAGASELTVSGFCERALRRRPVAGATRIVGIAPHPVHDRGEAVLTVSAPDDIVVELWSALGTPVARLFAGPASVGSLHLPLPPRAGSGVCYLVVRGTRGMDTCPVFYR